MKGLRFMLLPLILAVTACSTLSLDQQIYTADKGVTAVITSTDTALNQGAITKAQAQSVSTIAHQVGPLLDSARVANSAQDVTGATKTMQLVNTLLAGLQAYVIAPPQH